MEWFNKASCKGVSNRVFFLERGESTTEANQAKDICRSCPVILPCLNYAIETNCTYGIFGGMSPEERRVEKRKRKAEETKKKKLTTK